MHASIDVATVIDQSRLGRLQLVVLTLCALAVMLDGFDVQALAYVAPELVAQWGIARASLGPVFGASFFGMLIGSPCFGLLADRIGRRPVLMASLAFFGACSLATTQANSVTELLLLRFFTGIGLGALMPNALALAGEYSPSRLRVSVTILVSGAFVAGGALAGFVAAVLVPRFGWQSIFFVGGVAPIGLAVVMLGLLPESVQFQVLRDRGSAALGRTLRRIDPTLQVSAGTAFVVRGPADARASVVELFRGGRGAGTVALWGFNFLSLLTVFFLSSWLPLIVRGLGFSAAQASLAGAALQAGGLLGTLTLGRAVERLGFVAVLGAAFLVASMTIAAIGQLTMATALLFVLVFLAGFCVFGGQGVLNAMASHYYPTSLRSTGLGWSLGVGRIGSIAGPIVGGELLRLSWSNDALFVCAAVPAMSCVVALLVMRTAMAGRSRVGSTWRGLFGIKQAARGPCSLPRR